MNEVHVLDAGGGTLMVAKFKEDHLVLMAKRGWIRQNTWIIKDRTVNTMSVDHLKEFIEETT